MSLSRRLTETAFLATQHRGLVEEQLRSWDEDPRLRVSAQRFGTSVYDRVWEIVGPLHLTSGYRCGALNRAVGGRPNSRHVLGLAADVQPLELGIRAALQRIAAAIVAGALPDVDEAIVEMGWIHLQAAPLGQAPRRLVLQTSDGVAYRPFEAHPQKES